MNALDRLREKYEPALREMEGAVRLVEIALRNDKLYIHGAVESKELLERFLSALDEIDADWNREVDLNIHAPGELKPHTGQTAVNQPVDLSH
ncbi:MAG: hypothetical protein ABSH09_01500 [Bryobacteraceae bacterium]|jgi:hypothetical protein